MGAAEKVAGVLESMLTRPGGWSAAEIGAAAGMSRAAAARLMRSLTEQSLLEYDNRTDSYYLGVRMLLFGEAARTSLGPLEALHEPMLQFADRHQVALLFTVTRGPYTYPLVRADPGSPSGTVAPVAYARPTHASAAGRVYLSFGNLDTVPAVLSGGFEKLTEHTVGTPEELDAELKQTAKQGYATAEEELRAGQFVVAVPILNDGGQAIGAFAVSLSDRDEFELAKRRLIGSLQDVAGTASRLLGYGRVAARAV